MDPAEYPARAELASGSCQYLPEQLASVVLLNVPPGAQLGLHFMLAPSCFECALTLRLGKGDAFVFLWAVNKQLRLIPPSGFFLEGAWLLLTEPMFEFSGSARRQVEFDTQTGG